MLNFRTDTGFQILGADSDLIDPTVFFECLQRPWLFGDVPVRADIFQLISLFGAPVTRISKDECFFTVQKLVGLIEVVFVCRSCRETVRDAGAGINPDVSLQSGKDSVLPHHPPLRTVRESHPSYGSSLSTAISKTEHHYGTIVGGALGKRPTPGQRGLRRCVF